MVKDNKNHYKSSPYDFHVHSKFLKPNDNLLCERNRPNIKSIFAERRLLEFCNLMLGNIQLLRTETQCTRWRQSEDLFQNLNDLGWSKTLSGQTVKPPATTSKQNGQSLSGTSLPDPVWGWISIEQRTDFPRPVSDVNRANRHGLGLAYFGELQTGLSETLVVRRTMNTLHSSIHKHGYIWKTTSFIYNYSQPLIKANVNYVPCYYVWSSTLMWMCVSQHGTTLATNFTSRKWRIWVFLQPRAL